MQPLINRQSHIFDTYKKVIDPQKSRFLGRNFRSQKLNLNPLR
jgi:hypothetical protein